MDTEFEAVVAAIRCCSKIDILNPRIVRIKDTLHLEYIQASENICHEIMENPSMEILNKV